MHGLVRTASRRRFGECRPTSTGVFDSIWRWSRFHSKGSASVFVFSGYCPSLFSHVSGGHNLVYANQKLLITPRLVETQFSQSVVRMGGSFLRVSTCPELTFSFAAFVRDAIPASSFFGSCYHLGDSVSLRHGEHFFAIAAFACFQESQSGRLLCLLVTRQENLSLCIRGIVIGELTVYTSGGPVVAVYGREQSQSSEGDGTNVAGDKIAVLSSLEVWR